MQKMSKLSGCGALVLVIALWWAAPMPVHALTFNPAVEYATEWGFGSADGTNGYQFSTSVPFNIDALAYWDITHVGGGYLNSNHQVGLWDSGGTLLVSTTVLTTDPIQGHFQYHAIPMYSLGPGTYTIGGEPGLVPIVFAGVVTVPGFTWITAVVDPINSPGLNYPTLDYDSAYGQNGILTVNFSITSASAVPESSTLILLAAGLLLCYGWRRKRAA